MGNSRRFASRRRMSSLRSFSSSGVIEDLRRGLVHRLAQGLSHRQGRVALLDQVRLLALPLLPLGGPAPGSADADHPGLRHLLVDGRHLGLELTEGRAGRAHGAPPSSMTQFKFTRAVCPGLTCPPRSASTCRASAQRQVLLGPLANNLLALGLWRRDRRRGTRRQINGRQYDGRLRIGGWHHLRQ